MMGKKMVELRVCLQVVEKVELLVEQKVDQKDALLAE